MRAVRLAPSGWLADRLGLPAPQKALSDPAANPGVAYDNEDGCENPTPGARCAAFENAIEHDGLDVDLRSKMPDVAPERDHLVDRAACLVGKCKIGFRIKKGGRHAGAFSRSSCIVSPGGLCAEVQSVSPLTWEPTLGGG